MVAYPFCLFDCDIPVQGAVAIVLTTADRARDLKPTPAYLAGYGQRLHFEVAGRIGSLSSYMEGGSSSAKLTWERSGFSPKDVDVAQIYDGFSASVIYGLESYGFCKEGEALDFIQDGRIELDGELPLNTFGGSLGTGRIHGLWHIIEGALAGLGPRRLAPGQGRQRVVRRRQRPDRDRHDLHLRARAVLTRRAHAQCRAARNPPLALRRVRGAREPGLSALAGAIAPAPPLGLGPAAPAGYLIAGRIAAAVIVHIAGAAGRRRGARYRIGGAGNRTGSGANRPANDRTNRAGCCRTILGPVDLPGRRAGHRTRRISGRRDRPAVAV